MTDTVPENKANEEPRPFTYDEEARLFAVLPEPYKPFVTLALNTGLRMNELRCQSWRDIDLEHGVLTVTRPKCGRAPRTLPLNATARAVLASIERTSPLVFPSLPKRLTTLFTRYVAKARLPADLTFHCLRDTYLSRLAPRVSPTTLMRLAWHRDFKTTQRYLAIEENYLREAVETLALPGSLSVMPASPIPRQPDRRQHYRAREASSLSQARGLLVCVRRASALI